MEAKFNKFCPGFLVLHFASLKHEKQAVWECLVGRLLAFFGGLKKKLSWMFRNVMFNCFDVLVYFLGRFFQFFKESQKHGDILQLWFIRIPGVGKLNIPILVLLSLPLLLLALSFDCRHSVLTENNKLCPRLKSRFIQDYSLRLGDTFLRSNLNVVKVIRVARVYRILSTSRFWGTLKSKQNIC